MHGNQFDMRVIDPVAFKNASDPCNYKFCPQQARHLFRCATNRFKIHIVQTKNVTLEMSFWRYNGKAEGIGVWRKERNMRL